MLKPYYGSPRLCAKHFGLLTAPVVSEARLYGLGKAEETTEPAPPDTQKAAGSKHKCAGALANVGQDGRIS